MPGAWKGEKKELHLPKSHKHGNYKDPASPKVLAKSCVLKIMLLAVAPSLGMSTASTVASAYEALLWKGLQSAAVSGPEL